MYVWQISFDVQPQIQSIIVTFSKAKMNGNSYLHILLQCHLNVTCLVVLVILISKVSIDVIFFFTDHTICQNSKSCVSIDMHFVFGCKYLRVKCYKLAKTLSKIHIGRHCHRHYRHGAAEFPPTRTGWEKAAEEDWLELLEGLEVWNREHNCRGCFNQLLSCSSNLAEVERGEIWCKYCRY